MEPISLEGLAYDWIPVLPDAHSFPLLFRGSNEVAEHSTTFYEGMNGQQIKPIIRPLHQTAKAVGRLKPHVASAKNISERIRLNHTQQSGSR